MIINMPESFKFEQREQQIDPKDLLLTPEQSRDAAKERGKPPYIIREKQGENEIVVYGTLHQFDINKLKDLEELLESENPDAVLVEGKPKDALLKELTEKKLSDEEIVKEYGEETYMQLLAQRRGIKVKSWDAPPLDQLQYALEKGNSPEAIIGYLTMIVSRYIREQGKVPMQNTIIEKMKLMLSDDVVGGG